MKTDGKIKKKKAFACAGIIMSAIFAFTLIGDVETAHARDGYCNFYHFSKKWRKLIKKRHKKPVETTPIECGATIGPGGYYRLDADLDCKDYVPEADSEKAALTVVGPVTVDLRGHSIIGNSNMGGEKDPGSNEIDGILVLGERAKIRNGAVTECYNGVVVSGDGKHRVFKINAYYNEEAGFAVNSDLNRLTLNTASDNLDNGFYFIGSSNWFVKNGAEGNGDEGFYGPEESGQNKIFLNSAIANEDDGIQVVGHENRLIHNYTKESWDSGFNIDGDRNVVYKNKAHNNTKDGIEIDGNENRIVRNRAAQNERYGISVSQKTSKKKYVGDDNINNIIKRNIAKENVKSDLHDGVGDSEGNTWKRNRFETHNQDYIE